MFISINNRNSSVTFLEGAGKNFSIGLALCLATMLTICIPDTAWAGGKVAPDFNPANFSNPLTINNEFHPLVPGTVFTYRAEGEDGCEEDVVTVTNTTRLVAGVTARVVEDLAYEDEECDGNLSLVERTNDWFAQDDFGNVWYLGEDSNDCDENGCVPSEGSWEAGVDGAEAGIIMLAHPRPGDQYYQEFYEEFAEDQAKVIRTNAWISLYREDAVDHDFRGCLVTKEWTKLEPGEVENKFYCPDVGLVAIKELKGKTLRFELVDISGP